MTKLRADRGPRGAAKAVRTVGHSQLPNFGVQFFDLLLVNHWGFLTATLEHAGGSLQQRPLPAVDHRRMNPEPAAQFGYRLFTLQRLQRHLRLELRHMLLSFRHL